MLSTRGVLKENELYWVGDRHYVAAGGQTGRNELGRSETGLYRRDTRFLSHYEWQLDGEPFQPLMQHLRYPWWLREESGNHNLGYTMHTGLSRDFMLTGAELLDRVKLTRYRDQARELRLVLAADFRDMFEVRAAVGDEGDWPSLDERGVTVSAGKGRVEFAYSAADGLRVRTLVESSPPGRWDGSALVWSAEEDLEVEVRAYALQGGELPRQADLVALVADYATWTPPETLPDPLDQRVLAQSLQDLRSLLFWTPQGPFPAAGIPWFVAPFGRDSLIMAHLLLPHRPEVALGVARYLAARQGAQYDAFTLEQPGKILHEERVGELTRSGKTQHRPYYASADATPLFVWLCGEIGRRDPSAARELRPHWEAGLRWLETDGDPDGDLLIEYRPDPHGMRNQVWKDSGDSTFFETGEDAQGLIAVAEVQGYAYAAYLAGAGLYEAAGEGERAASCRERARALQRRFHDAFYWPERGYYVHGLNGDKRPMKVLVSNPAHALWTGIIPPEHAAGVVRTALGEELWSGWGIRTLGTRELRFNPVSYHNGSVWPHDTALAALGMARYGFGAEASVVARALFDAARWAPDARLPELYAGFERDGGPPVPYPAACHPQGWDAVLPLALAPLLPKCQAVAAD